MTTHRLRTWPEYFSAVADGSKPFEIRDDDRDFKVGDELLLLEWTPPGRDDPAGYTGGTVLARITYIADGACQPFALLDGYVVLGLSLISVGGNPVVPSSLHECTHTFDDDTVCARAEIGIDQ